MGTAVSVLEFSGTAPAISASSNVAHRFPSSWSWS
jgi:hypothetical protein